MKISKVKTAIKAGDFVLRDDGHKNFIKFVPKIDKDLYKSDVGRIYIFTSNGVIKKIGGSKSKGGLKTTIGFYTSSMTGNPGAPRYIIHLLIRDELTAGKKVECYMIPLTAMKAPVPGLFDADEEQLVTSFSESETRCNQDYYESCGHFPPWNFQESHQSYPSEYWELFIESKQENN